jgi:hypothetical protein
MINSIFKRAMMMLVFVVTMMSATIPARAQLEPGPTSRLLGIALPLSPQRITDPGLLAAYDPRLQAIAAKAKGKMVDTEVLIWGQGGDEIKQQVADVVKYRIV